MKKYDHVSKKWLTEEEWEEKNRKLKKSKLCRGGKPHSFKLVLPWHVQAIGDPTEEAITQNSFTHSYA